MVFTPLDTEKLKANYKKHKVGPLLIFIIIIMIAILAALMIIFLQKQP